MIRIRQTLEELLQQISSLPASWEDQHSRDVITLLEGLPNETAGLRAALTAMVSSQQEAAATAIRLALDLSKDDFKASAREALGAGGFAWKDLREEPEAIQALLDGLGVVPAFERAIATPVTWRSVLVERLKSGRGSAIKGQQRGRGLEDFVEGIVASVFGTRFNLRCRFLGAKGTSEKADFAIPSADDPQILIEVKAYGATGSKQTDIIGDMVRIAEQKRNDTLLFLVTDGTTWRARTSDLRKLVEMQNQGKIARIYTKAMGELLRSDLAELKRSSGLP
jgi:hypothetical protein